MKNHSFQWMVFAAVASLLWGGLAAADDLTESPDGPEHVKVYLDLEQALDKVFPGADKIWSEEWVPTPEEKQVLEFALGWHLGQASFVFHLVNHRW